MKRSAIPALVFAVAVVSGSAACTTVQPVVRVAAVPSPPTVPPRQLLGGSAPSVSFVSYRFSFTDDDGTKTGLVDPPNRRSETTTNLGVQSSGTLYRQVIAIGDQIWEKIGETAPNQTMVSYHGLPTAWMHLDPNRTPGPAISAIRTSDQTGIGIFLDAIGSAERTGPMAYRGTLRGYQLDSWGKPAMAIPFTATVDSQGRLRTFATTARVADWVYVYRATFTDYGLPTPITAPTNATDAPAALYTLLD